MTRTLGLGLLTSTEATSAAAAAAADEWPSRGCAARSSDAAAGAAAPAWVAILDVGGCSASSTSSRSSRSSGAGARHAVRDRRGAGSSHLPLDITCGAVRSGTSSQSGSSTRSGSAPQARRDPILYELCS